MFSKNESKSFLIWLSQYLHFVYHKQCLVCMEQKSEDIYPPETAQLPAKDLSSNISLKTCFKSQSFKLHFFQFAVRSLAKETSRHDDGLSCTKLGCSLGNSAPQNRINYCRAQAPLKKGANWNNCNGGCNSRTQRSCFRRRRFVNPQFPDDDVIKDKGNMRARS